MTLIKTQSLKSNGSHVSHVNIGISIGPVFHGPIFHYLMVVAAEAVAVAVVPDDGDWIP